MIWPSNGDWSWTLTRSKIERPPHTPSCGFFFFSFLEESRKGEGNWEKIKNKNKNKNRKIEKEKRKPSLGGRT